MSEKEFIKFYRNQVENRREVPPDSCWDEISRRLDLEDAWDGISAELDRVMPVETRMNKRSYIRIAALAASLALLTLIFSPFWRNTSGDKSETAQLSTDEKTEQPGVTEPLSDRAFTGTAPQGTGTAPDRLTDIITNKNATGISKSDMVANVVHADSNAGLLSTETDLPEIIQANYNVTVTSGYIEIPSLFSEVFQVIADSSVPVQNAESTGRGRFYAGLLLSGKNTWLLSEETFNGLNKYNLNTTKINFLNDVGFTLRYSPDARWLFEGSGFISSKNEQSYRQYINGIYSDKSYVLRYSSIEITLARKIRRANAGKTSAILTAGGYISYLHSAYKVLNSSEINISDQYKPLDYGLVIGSGLDIPVAGYFILNPGFRLRYGFPNIFAGQDAFPGSLNNTRNASIEFRINIMMPFRKM